MSTNCEQNIGCTLKKIQHISKALNLEIIIDQ